MKFVVIILFALFYFSCGQSTAKNNIPEEAKELIADPEGDQKDPFLMGSPQPGSGMVYDENKHSTLNEAIDTLPESLKIFVPQGYSAINISSGDASLDGRTDRILVLRKNTEEGTSNIAAEQSDKRPLLLLLEQSDYSYQLAIRNDNAVCCIDCGGAFGDPFTGTTIKNGVFSIEHGIAGGQHWEQVTTFKFDKAKNKWFLYKDHFISYQLNNSNDPDAEALVKKTDRLKTVKDFGIISFNTFNIDKDS